MEILIRERISFYKERLKHAHVLLDLYIKNEEWFMVASESTTINAVELILGELRALLDG